MYLNDTVSVCYVFLTHFPLTSQVHSGGHPVPDYRKDLRNERPGRDGQPVGDVHPFCYCGPRHPRPRRSAAALLHGDQEQSWSINPTNSWADCCRPSSLLWEHHPGPPCPQVHPFSDMMNQTTEFLMPSLLPAALPPSPSPSAAWRRTSV